MSFQVHVHHVHIMLSFSPLSHHSRCLPSFDEGEVDFNEDQANTMENCVLVKMSDFMFLLQRLMFSDHFLN